MPVRMNFSELVQKTKCKARTIYIETGKSREDSIRKAVDTVSGNASEELRQDLYSVVDEEWANGDKSHLKS